MKENETVNKEKQEHMDEMGLFKRLMERELSFMYFPTDMMNELWNFIIKNIK